MGPATNSYPSPPPTAPGCPLRLQPISGPSIPGYDVPGGGRAVVGKDVACQIRLEHPAVSRSHAMIEAAGSLWLITDLSSRNGTYLNGERLTPNRPMPLTHGDHLRIQPWIFRVNLSAAEPEPRTIDDRASAADRLHVLKGRVPTAAPRLNIAALLKAAVAIHQSEDLTSLVRAVVEAALALTGFGQAAVIRRSSSIDRVEVLWSEVRGVGPSTFHYSRTLVEAALGGSSVTLRAPMELERSSSISELQISSAACLPLMLDGAAWGCLYLDSRGRHDVHADAAGELCQVLGELASLALRNVLKRDVESRLANLQREAEMAAQAQRLLLPPEHGCIAGLHYAMGFTPGRIVSGDLVGVVAVGESKTAAFLGDVTGKGMAAGLVMAAIQSYLTAALLRMPELSAAVDDLNRYMSERLPTGCYASLWIGVFDRAGRTLEYVDAGHSLAFIAGSGPLKALEGVDGLWLGVAPERPYRSRQVELGPGARLIVMSDGVVEQPGTNGEHFGFDRVVEAVLGSSSVRDDVGALMAEVTRHAGSPTPRDDVTVASFSLDAPG
jgi:phosphoserine phosphatase RsbU/P